LMHGYQHIIGTTSIVPEANDEQGRPLGTWSKPAYLLKVLLEELSKPEEDRLGWLFWSDADTLILDPHIKLENFIPPYDSPADSQVQLLITANMDGINAGVFLLRVHAWSVELLTAILAYRLYHPNDWLEQRDQSAMAEILAMNSQFRYNWTVVPSRWFNSFPFNYGFAEDGTYLLQYPMTTDTFDDGEALLPNGSEPNPWKVQKGDMLVHFAGVRQRSTWIDPWANRTEMYSPEWSSPIFQSRIEVEAEHFWEAWNDEVDEKARLAAMGARSENDVHPIKERRRLLM